jgi:thiamine pyrophosphate-dependent acetolactate synthase large subunit-like protein
LAIPVVKEWTASWSKPFPTKHPLYLGNYLSTSRFPGKVDVLLNVGSRMPLAGSQFRMESQVRLIQLRVDADNLARVYPTELAMVADIRLALADLLQELKRQASSRQLRSVVGQRMERARVHRKSTDEAYGLIARERWNNDPISGERVMVELEGLLEKDTLVVSDNDSYMGVIDNYLSYGPQDKDYFFSTGFTLGWGLPAAFGVKLAMPDRPVVCVVSDGSFLFSGPQPLWSYSRYQAPVLVIVMNNRSYNNERNRIMARRGRAYQAGRDMVCYLGDPDVNYVKLAEAFDVQAEEVKKPEDFRSAVQRGMKATAAGRAYLLDVHVERTGSLANSTWHPAYSISSTRSRSV